MSFPIINVTTITLAFAISSFATVAKQADIDTLKS